MASNDARNYNSFANSEFADLGRERFDQDTAAIGDRDNALHNDGHVYVRKGRAPAGMEAEIFKWSTFQYETEDRDNREELKGDLHGGQLHRQNRAARGEPTGPPPPPVARGGKRGRRGGAAGGQGGLEPLVCGKKVDDRTPMLAKGKLEELGDELFWDKPIC